MICDSIIFLQFLQLDNHLTFYKLILLSFVNIFQFHRNPQKTIIFTLALSSPMVSNAMCAINAKDTHTATTYNAYNHIHTHSLWYMVWWYGLYMHAQRGVSGAALVGRSCVHCLRTNENSPNPELSESNNELHKTFLHY